MTLPEKNETLWLLSASPLVWAAHFLFSYITAAIYCAKASSDGASLGAARVAIVVYTLIAVVAIAVIGRIGWKYYRAGDPNLPVDDDTPIDRHQFLGFATFLLSSLSLVATIFVALTIVFVGNCF